MAGSFIPSSIPANGRISTPSSRRLKKRNRNPPGQSGNLWRQACRLRSKKEQPARLPLQQQQQHPADVSLSVSFRRVKGASWPSHSGQLWRDPVQLWRQACRLRSKKEQPARLPPQQPFADVSVSVLFRRVKGAWWPSRSSKPLSVRLRPRRDRFDSCPLRHFPIGDSQFPNTDCLRVPTGAKQTVAAVYDRRIPQFPRPPRAERRARPLSPRALPIAFPALQLWRQACRLQSKKEQPARLPPQQLCGSAVIDRRYSPHIPRARNVTLGRFPLSSQERARVRTLR